MICVRPCGGLGPACITTTTHPTGGDDDENHRGLETAASMLHFRLSHTVRRQIPQPICCMKDHTVPVSNQTTLAGARPVLTVCAHPHLPGEAIVNPAASTFRLTLWWGYPAVDEDPGGRLSSDGVVPVCSPFACERHTSSAAPQ